MKGSGAILRSSPLQIGLFPLRRMPRTMSNSRITLRPLRLTDGSALSQITSRVNHFKHLRALKCWNGFRCWFFLKRVFPLAYVVEKGGRVVGFTGFYDVRVGNSAEMGLWISGEERRQGTGTEAADLLVGAAGRCGLVEEVLVRIEPGNRISSMFWEKMGFRQIQSDDDGFLTMKKDVGLW